MNQKFLSILARFAGIFAVTSLAVMSSVALAWTAPTAAPPNNNASEPLNRSTTSQAKTSPGGLDIGGNLLVNALSTTALSGNAFLVPTGNVGIGTLSPTYPLTVAGTSLFGATGKLLVSSLDANSILLRPGIAGGDVVISDDTATVARGMVIGDGGFVGIGLQPGAVNKFEVAGNIKASGSNDAASYCISGANCISTWPTGSTFTNSAAAGYIPKSTSASALSQSVILQESGTNYIGINNSNPSRQLDVTGGIIASGAIDAGAGIAATGNISAGGTITAGTNVAAATVNTTGNINAGGNVTGTNITAAGQVTGVTGNITGNLTVGGTANVIFLNATNQVTANSVTASAAVTGNTLCVGGSCSTHLFGGMYSRNNGSCVSGNDYNGGACSCPAAMPAQHTMQVGPINTYTVTFCGNN